MTKPIYKISVVIPSFNRAHLLTRTVDSVINQTYPVYEILIIDDCSTDNTTEVVDLIKQKQTNQNIRVIKHSINKGESGARNTGLREAKGDYIAWLDSDDEWLPDKLLTQVNYLVSNPDSTGVVCNYFIKNEHNESIQVKLKPSKIDAEYVLLNGSGFCLGTNLLFKNSPDIPDYDEGLRLFADIDWFYRLLRLSHFKIGFIPEALTVYYKADMREGDFVKQCAEVYALKRKLDLNRLTIFKKYKFYSYLNLTVALAYQANGQFFKAFIFYLKGLFCNPIRHPIVYKSMLVSFFKSMIRVSV